MERPFPAYAGDGPYVFVWRCPTSAGRREDARYRDPLSCAHDRLPLAAAPLPRAVRVPGLTEPLRRIKHRRCPSAGEHFHGAEA
jgi:hypothetical protein